MTRNLPIESGVRQWSHPLMILLHCLCAKSNNETRGQFERDMTWVFFFFFYFVRSHHEDNISIFTCTAWLLFHSLLERVVVGRVRLKLDLDEQGRWGCLKTGQFSWTSYVYRPLTRVNKTIGLLRKQQKILLYMTRVLIILFIRKWSQ